MKFRLQSLQGARVMKSINHLVLALSLLMAATTAGAFQTQEPAPFTVKFDGLGNERIIDTVADSDGNLFVTGYYQNGNEPDFTVYRDDNADGQRQLATTINNPFTIFSPVTNPQRSGRDIFIAKFNWLGELLWVRTAGGGGNDAPTGIVWDRTGGRVFLSGYVQGNDVWFLNSVNATQAGKGLDETSTTNLFVASIDSDGVWQQVDVMPIALNISGPSVPTDTAFQNINLAPADSELGNGLAIAIDQTGLSPSVVLYLKGQVKDSLLITSLQTPTGIWQMRLGLDGQTPHPLGLWSNTSGAGKFTSAGDWGFISKLTLTTDAQSGDETWQWNWMRRLDQSAIPADGVATLEPGESCANTAAGASVYNNDGEGGETGSGTLNVINREDMFGYTVRDGRSYAFSFVDPLDEMGVKLTGISFEFDLELETPVNLDTGEMSPAPEVQWDIYHNLTSADFATVEQAAAVLADPSISKTIIRIVRLSDLPDYLDTLQGSDFYQEYPDPNDPDNLDLGKAIIFYGRTTFTDYEPIELENGVAYMLSGQTFDVANLPPPPFLALLYGTYRQYFWQQQTPQSAEPTIETYQVDFLPTRYFYGQQHYFSIDAIGGRTKLLRLQADLHWVSTDVSVCQQQSITDLKVDPTLGLNSPVYFTGRYQSGFNVLGETHQSEAEQENGFIGTLMTDGTWSNFASVGGRSSLNALDIVGNNVMVAGTLQQSELTDIVFNSFQSSNDLILPSPPVNQSKTLLARIGKDGLWHWADASLTGVALDMVQDFDGNFVVAGAAYNTGYMLETEEPSQAYAAGFRVNATDDGIDLQWQKFSDNAPDLNAAYSYRLYRNNLNSVYLIGANLPGVAVGNYTSRDLTQADYLNGEGSIVNVLDPATGDFSTEFQVFDEFIVGEVIAPPQGGRDSMTVKAMRRSLPANIGLEVVGSGAQLNQSLLTIQANPSVYAAGPLQRGRLFWPTSDQQNDVHQAFRGRAFHIRWPSVAEGLQEYLYSTTADVTIPPVILDSEAWDEQFSWIQYIQDPANGNPATTGIAHDGTQLVSTENRYASLVFFESDNPVDALPIIVSSRSYAWNDPLKHQAESTPIGNTLVSPLNVDDDAGGLVMTPLARYDAHPLVYNPATREGQIIPVNRNGDLDSNGNRDDDLADDLIVTWYQHGQLNRQWPYQSRRYLPEWPTDSDVIILTSQKGSQVEEQGLLAFSAQSTDGLLIENSPSIYYQNNKSSAGFNPNEEHAFLLADGPHYIVHAIRNDLNNLNADTSEPFVLIRYQPTGASAFDYRLFRVEYAYGDYNDHNLSAEVGKPVYPPPYLRDRISQNTFPDSASETFWIDRNNLVWSRSAGDPANPTSMEINWYYDLTDESFWYDTDGDGEAESETNNIAWQAWHQGGDGSEPFTMTFQNQWPEDIPEIHLGETLIDPRNGLPGVKNMKHLQVIYDTNDFFDLADPASADRADNATVRLYNYQQEIRSSNTPLPGGLQFVVSADNNGPVIRVEEGSSTVILPARVQDVGVYDFPELPSDLRYRLRFRSLPDPSGGYFYFRGGEFNANNGSDAQDGDSVIHLTNIMTDTERDTLKALDREPDTTITPWDKVVDGLHLKSRNPNDVDLDNNAGPDNGIYVGFAENESDELFHQTVDAAVALTTAFANKPGYVVLAENVDDPQQLNNPVNVHVIRVVEPKSNGNVNVLLNELNKLATQVVLRQNLDFGGRTDELQFEWYWSPDSGEGGPPTWSTDVTTGAPVGWTPLHEIGAEGNASIYLDSGMPLLADGWVLSRYRGLVTDNDPAGGWSELAGAPLQAGQPVEPVFVAGWVKRVMEDINEFDQRYTDFNANDVVSYTSMLTQAGAAYQGNVALTSEDGNLNQVGLLELYHTILNYARTLSVDATNPIQNDAVNKQLLFAASRIASLYILLGNEAVSDALDPTIGILSNAGETGYLQPSLHAFQNQTSDLLDEELALLRGTDDGNVLTGNRLLWNFIGGAEEATYVQVYGVSDLNNDGSVNESDARILYPQGHGDAWGHFLTTTKLYYSLARHPNYDWTPLTDTVSFGGVSFTVDYRDEELFARAAANKAQTGARIVDLTFRNEYTHAPSGQWQGYKDSEPERAWGMDGWAKRTGQGAYLDWIMANGILPWQDTNPDGTPDTGLSRIDRQTVKEIERLPATVGEVERIVQRADRGNNPFGLAGDSISFDISANKLVEGESHFEQIYGRALQATQNALEIFNYANGLTQQIRAGQLGNADLQDLDAVKEREFKNRLIELMGYPYSGNIGPGKLYPTGYNGPDLYQFMFIDSDLPPLPASQVRTAKVSVPLDNNVLFPADVPNGTDLQAHFNAATNEFVENDGNGSQLLFNFPVNSSQYGFIRPDSSWGVRQAKGEIQLQLGQIQQTHAKINTALTEQQALVAQIQSEINLMEAIYGLRTGQITAYDALKAEYDDLSSQAAANQSRAYALQMAGESIYRGTGLMLSGFSLANGIGSNDFTWAARLAVAAGAVGALSGISSGSLVAASGGATSQFGKQSDAQKAAFKQSFEIQKSEYPVEMQRQLTVIENLVQSEAVIRYNLVELLQELDNAESVYHQLVAEAGRVMQERVEFRKDVAGRVAEDRYVDMTYRVFRNDALTKYRASFDLAAKYAYFAAKAYDYETGLLPDGNHGVDQGFYEDIIRERVLGQFTEGGQPIGGVHGLSAPLHQMATNFSEDLNPLLQEFNFSLRKEAYRVLADDAGQQRWQTLLQNSRVDNLWDLPEFSQFAVAPGVSPADGPIPGLVLRFNTMVYSGKNLFGWDLGPGDSNYSPTYTATKLFRVGLHFDAYPQQLLAQTPYAYLVPTGTDIMRSRTNNTQLRSYQVLDQVIPRLTDLSDGNLNYQTNSWIASHDLQAGELIRERKHRQLPVGIGEFNFDNVTTAGRLVGRSVWNTEWLLIIPGDSLYFDPEEGINRLINGDTQAPGISDIRLVFDTYSVGLE